MPIIRVMGDPSGLPRFSSLSRPTTLHFQGDGLGVKSPRGSNAPAASSARPRRLIGDIAVELGYATREEIEDAVDASRERGVPTGQILLERKVLRDDELAKVLAERFGVRYIDLSTLEPDMGAATLLSVEAIRRYEAIPMSFEEDGSLLLAMADPANVLTVDDVTMITGRRVRVAAAAASDIARLVARLDRASDSIEGLSEHEEEGADESEPLTEEADRDAPIIKLVHSIIAQAVAQGASDVHINPQEGDTEVELRVDGVLHKASTVKRKLTRSVISRIKIMAELDISERRKPQDGRFALTVEGSRVDIRVVTLPLVHGEGVVMRILDASSNVRMLSSLGIGADDLKLIEAAIKRPNGAILVTGPTGSGKSTTLYAALSAMGSGPRSVITIEDPVEARLRGIKQIQVSQKAGLTFETGLRSMLRSDPDVIMVGEIRDRPTAQIAIEAALTGHLVISTLHTRDAPSALSRLIDMGIEPFLVSSAIDCVIAQRLIRLLCEHCKARAELPDEVLERYGLLGSQPYSAVGCPRCGGSGYRGRMGVYEVMSVTEEMKSSLLQRATVKDMGAIAERQGMRRLRDDGLKKVKAGLTTIEEIERMTASVL